MDSVRFGRALGVGVREAAKAAVKAADAVAAPAPTAAAPSPAARPQAERPAEVRGPLAARPTARAVPTTPRALPTAQGLKQGGKRFGEAVWGPFAKLSGVLWHEIMGVLFGMFAAVAGVEVWHGRGSLRAGAEGRTHELLAIAMLAGFGYFTASSFVRASRRQKL